MNDALRIDVVPHATLDPGRYAEVVALCERAYEEPFAGIMAAFPDATHVLASTAEELVSHALWVPRTLVADGRALRSAYVEAVATEPRHQGRGYASRVLRAVAAAITGYDVGALSPSDAAFYARLGWEAWRGPLAVATDAGMVPTPDEEVMILRLPATPPLDTGGTLVAPWRVGDVW
jgi:GNAT superfamily N-acetyltransferase